VPNSQNNISLCRTTDLKCQVPSQLYLTFCRAPSRKLFSSLIGLTTVVIVEHLTHRFIVQGVSVIHLRMDQQRFFIHQNSSCPLVNHWPCTRFVPLPVTPHIVGGRQKIICSFILMHPVVNLNAEFVQNVMNWSQYWRGYSDWFSLWSLLRHLYVKYPSDSIEFNWKDTWGLIHKTLLVSSYGFVTFQKLLFLND
jgi:hypothetical protein